jgi:carboxymethylenebutenolidase
MTAYTADEQALIEAWERHTRLEFSDREPRATVATMKANSYVNHIPVLTGGRGRDEVLDFYAKHFITRMPADTSLTLVSRTVGQSRVIDEMIFAFTHSIQMDWMLPGIAPTGLPVQIPLVAVVQFEGDLIAFERIYWDQASVLVQIGLLDAAFLPVSGADTAHKVLDPTLPSNQLIMRGRAPDAAS